MRKGEYKQKSKAYDFKLKLFNILKVLIEKPWVYILYKNDDERMIFSIIAGSVGLYQINIALNSDEILSYNLKGIKFLNDFAKHINRYPENFLNRNIKI